MKAFENTYIADITTTSCAMCNGNLLITKADRITFTIKFYAMLLTWITYSEFYFSGSFTVFVEFMHKVRSFSRSFSSDVHKLSEQFCHPLTTLTPTITNFAQCTLLRNPKLIRFEDPDNASKLSLFVVHTFGFNHTFHRINFCN